jgi:hypothetical protein
VDQHHSGPRLAHLGDERLVVGEADPPKRRRPLDARVGQDFVDDGKRVEGAREACVHRHVLAEREELRGGDPGTQSCAGVCRELPLRSSSRGQDRDRRDLPDGATQLGAGQRDATSPLDHRVIQLR